MTSGGIYHCSECGNEITISADPTPTTDIMATAKDLFNSLASPGDEAEYWPKDVALIARALVTERERCAKIAEAFRETTVDDRAALVDAIRNPK